MPLTLEIVTPTQLALRKTVDSFTAPGVIGEFGILPGHRPLLASLRSGVARYLETGSTEKRLAIGPGLAELDNERIIVLTDKVLDPAKLASSEDREAELQEATTARDKADSAMRAWTGPTTDSEFDENRLALEWAQARIAALRP